MKDINNFYIYCAKSSHSDGRVAFRTNFYTVLTEMVKALKNLECKNLKKIML